jgi:hypothetical protein
MTTPTKPRTKHGLSGLIAKVSVKGLGALDRRSAGYRALVAWRTELERDLGGPERLSAQQKTLVELACRNRLLLDSIDGWLMRQDGVVNKRSRSALPILATRMQLHDSLVRVLGQLGLSRAEKPIESVAEYIAKFDRDKQANAAPDDSTEETADQKESEP